MQFAAAPKRWNDRSGISASQLKWLALAAMFLDHLNAVFGASLYRGAWLEPILSTGYSGWMHWVGRLAFPIFAFLVARGVRHTRSLTRYAVRLGLFALLAQIPYTMALHGLNSARIGDPEGYPLLLFSWSNPNILFTLLLGLLAITLWEKQRQNRLWGLGVPIPFALAACFSCDYGMLGVLLIFLLWRFPTRRGTGTVIVAFSALNYLVEWNRVSQLRFSAVRDLLWNVQQLVPWLVHPSVSLFMPFFFSCASLVFLLRYNGARGHTNRWLFYVFYPAHLFALALARELMICLAAG